MGHADDPLSRLGRAVADAQDETLRDAHHLARGRQRFFAAARRTAPTRRAVVAVLCAAALALAALFARRIDAPTLTFLVGPGSERGAVGDAIRASEAPVTIAFSDGSHLSLAAAASGRVSRVEERGATFALEHGEAEIAIAHRPGQRWRVDAGPFAVAVTGTRFVVNWEPGPQELSVRLLEGSVDVSGPLVGSSRRVATGETLHVSVLNGRFELASAQTSRPDAESSDVSVPTAGSGRAPPPASAPASAPASPPRWRELARAERYREAVAAAEHWGFADLCGTLEAQDLMVLADAARFGGAPGRAAEALGSMRRRFPGTELAATSAFLLGKIAFDQRGAHAEAVTWFELYLSERSAGALAAEAVSRLMEAHERSGNRAAARAAAERYLARFPTGARAEHARSLLAYDADAGP